ncbi:hypothetical protein C8J56DRAFT_363418 [Mycena floridula]|nr:hypothetical protein C8J56DRAFT_363418 [Mycena floridula]
MRYHIVLFCLHVLGVFSALAPFDSEPALSRRTGTSGPREMWIVTFGGMRPTSWNHWAIYLSPFPDPPSRPNRSPPRNAAAGSLFRRAKETPHGGYRRKGQSAAPASPEIELSVLSPPVRGLRQPAEPRPAVELARPSENRGRRKPSERGRRPAGLTANNLPPSDIWDLKVPGNNAGFCCGTSKVQSQHRFFAPSETDRYSPGNSRPVSRKVIVDNAYMDRVTEGIRAKYRFHPTLNNCQSWVLKVLEQMVVDGKLRQQDVDAIRQSVKHTMSTSDIRRTLNKLKTSALNTCRFE